MHNAKTEMLEAGRYIDALQVTIGDIVSPLWIGVILVAANLRRATLPLETEGSISVSAPAPRSPVDLSLS